jgi:hypothetical protein
MPIEFEVRPNRSSEGRQGYKAQVVHSRSLEEDEVVDHICAGSSLDRNDVVEVLDRLTDLVTDVLLDGAMVRLRLVQFRSRISGQFDAPHARLDPNRNQVLPSVVPGAALRGAYAERVEANRKRKTPQGPVLSVFTDDLTGTRSLHATPAGLGTLRGRRLRFDREDVREGIFFVDGDGRETRVEEVLTNTPQVLTFVIPHSLGTGKYRIEVRARWDGVLRRGELSSALIVL